MPDLDFGVVLLAVILAFILAFILTCMLIHFIRDADVDVGLYFTVSKLL
jgi:hypothetical protein